MATNTNTKGYKSRLYRPEQINEQQSETLKDVLSNMDMDELAKEQPIDKVRYRKIAEDDEALQQIGAFNGKRPWNRQLVEYLDHCDNTEVYTFIRHFPDGASTWGKRKGRGRLRLLGRHLQWRRKRRYSPPISEIRVGENTAEDLRILREEYQKCTTNQEKRDFLSDLFEAETKSFAIHGQHLTWNACQALFGASKEVDPDSQTDAT
jgi:hypothetical protein